MTFSIVIMVGRGYFLPTHVHEASKIRDHENSSNDFPASCAVGAQLEGKANDC